MKETPEDLQKKLYLLQEQLQNMASELPPKFQMRIPLEILSSLANCLLNETIFEIVKGLMDIQHVTEKNLMQQRLHLITEMKIEEEQILGKCGLTAQEKVDELKRLKEIQKQKIKDFDMTIARQLDEKVTDQQTYLEQAGVPGFYRTTNSTEIKVQMYLLHFILKLSKMVF